jgi:hypothetical protein
LNYIPEKLNYHTLTNKNVRFMSKVIYLTKTPFIVVKKAIYDEIERKFQSLDDKDRKRLLKGVNANSLDDVLKPYSYCVYVRRSEKLRILTFIQLGVASLDLCTEVEARYVPGTLIPKKLAIRAIQIDTPYFPNNVNREFVYHILVDVAKAAQKVIDGK